jgi:hypothetical protein
MAAANRNGTSAKTILTEDGEIDIAVPVAVHDRARAADYAMGA